MSDIPVVQLLKINALMFLFFMVDEDINLPIFMVDGDINLPIFMVDGDINLQDQRRPRRSIAKNQCSNVSIFYG